MAYEIDTRCAKIASHPDGRDSIYIEGVIVPLAIDDMAQNNLYVEKIVRGLRAAGREVACDESGSLAGAIVGHAAAIPS